MSRIFLPGTRNVPEKALLTGKGERKKIMLPDSTLVWLAPCSELKYPEQFTEGSAHCAALLGKPSLKSPAMHNILYHPAYTIINHCKKALGTAFNIHAYPEDTNITVTLLNGSVCIKRSGNDEQRLMPACRKGFFGKNSCTSVIYMTRMPH